jgi:hypothetical protein
MRALGAILAAMLAAGCEATRTPAAPSDSAAPAATAAAPDGCLVSAHRVVGFTAPDAQDRLEASAAGPSCQQAIVTLSVRKADGTALWADAAPYAQLVVADAALPQASPGILRQFLEAMLAGAQTGAAADAPDWPASQATLATEDGALDETRLPREFYVQLRARGAPMVCLPFGQHSQTCLYYDPASDGAGELFTSAS